MSFVISLIDRPKKISYCSGILGDLNEVEIKKITHDININGYHIFENKLPEDIIQSLLDYAKTQECYLRPTDNDMMNSSTLIKTKYDPNFLKATVYDIDPNDSIKQPNVQKLLNDISLIAIAQHYLKASPKLEPPAFWWSTPFQKNSDKNAAQQFHFDMDRFKWLKFFIFLTDVSIENGPHVFIKGSHLSGKIPKMFLKKGYVRLDDKDVYNHYSKDAIQVFTVPAGTIIAEDTRGLHKGTNLVNGERLVLEFQFSNCLFGAESKPIKSFGSQTIPNNIPDLVIKYPKIYQLFNNN